MGNNTDKKEKILKNIISQNPGIETEKSIYAFCYNKIPVHNGKKTLKQSVNKKYNSIAITTYKSNYMKTKDSNTSQ